MFNLNEIKPHMPVVCSEGGQFAVVDHLEGKDAIKLTRDRNGQHHYIPVSWVRSVDTQVHVDRPGDQAMKEWSTSPPPSIQSPRGSDEGTRERMDASAENPLGAERVRSQQEGMSHPERDPQRAERLRTKN
jgi:hypothetical protein